MRLLPGRSAYHRRIDTRELTKEIAEAETRWRRKFAAAAARVTPYVAVQRDGLLLFFSTASRVGQRRFAQREWREERQLDRATRVLEQVGIRSGHVFVDIGAHVGTTTVYALARRGFGSAYCFEPGPENARVLRANLAANGLESRARVFEVALASSDGSAWLTQDTTGSECYRLGGDEVGQAALAVKTATFDGLVEAGEVRVEDIGLVWVDVEGAEASVFEGARTLLGQGVPLVVELLFDRAGTERSAAVDGLLRGSYTHFIDLWTPDFKQMPFQDLEALAELAAAKKKKDVLFVRLPH
jgi:FkbM family methyltransferase